MFQYTLQTSGQLLQTLQYTVRFQRRGGGGFRIAKDRQLRKQGLCPRGCSCDHCGVHPSFYTTGEKVTKSVQRVLTARMARLATVHKMVTPFLRSKLKGEDCIRKHKQTNTKLVQTADAPSCNETGVSGFLNYFLRRNTRYIALRNVCCPALRH